MLKALKIQLNQLAAERGDDFRETIGLMLGKDDASLEAAELKNFIVLMPDMIYQIRAWADDPSVPAELRRLHGFALTYLYHPVDLLPEVPYGLYGYLDDAYLIGEVYHRTMFQAKARPAVATVADLMKNMSSWLALTRQVIPAQATKIDIMLEDLLHGDTAAFEDSLRPH